MSKGENNSNGSFVSIAVVPFLGTTTTQMWILPLGKPQIGDTTKTRETETSKYPKEEKSTEIPLVVASERGELRAWALKEAQACVKQPVQTATNGIRWKT